MGVQQPKADGTEPTEGTEKNGDESTEKESEIDNNPDYILENDTCGIFRIVCSRLHWSNPLGLAFPTSSEESLKAWSVFKGLQVDFGPRAKRRGNPGLDRISSNLYTFM